ncbi:hypothetical protein [Actinomadura macra]|nr:hypothetical protein [Actinomadura macra]
MRDGSVAGGRRSRTGRIPTSDAAARKADSDPPPASAASTLARDALDRSR